MSSIATGSVAMHRPRARTSSRGSDFALRNCSAGSIGGAATGIRWPLRMSLAVYLQRRNSRQLQLTCASGRRASRQDFNHGVRRGRLLRARLSPVRLKYLTSATIVDGSLTRNSGSRRTLLAFATLRFAAVVAVDVTLGPLPHRYPVITLRNKQGWLPGAASLVRRPKWGCGV
jgi:hypothetical protein